MENKPSGKIVTILVGGGIEEGDLFRVAGRAGSIGEARRACCHPDFIRRHICGRSEGAYVLLVSHSGHHVFLPLGEILRHARGETAKTVQTTGE